MYDATHKTKVGVGKDHAIVVSGLDTLGVHDGTTRGSQELDTTLPCPVDIVREGEKGVGRASDAGQLGHVLLLFLLGQRFGGLFKQAVPMSLFTWVSLKGLTSDKEVDCVGLVGSLGSLFER